MKELLTTRFVNKLNRERTWLSDWDVDDAVFELRYPDGGAATARDIAYADHSAEGKSRSTVDVVVVFDVHGYGNFIAPELVSIRYR